VGAGTEAETSELYLVKIDIGLADITQRGEKEPEQKERKRLLLILFRKRG